MALAALCVAAFGARAAGAAESTSPRVILSIGCHNINGTCFMTLDGGPFGGSLGCAVGASNDVRWDNASDLTPEGRRAFAAMYAAFLAGRHVLVTVDGCSNQGFNKLAWYYVQS